MATKNTKLPSASWLKNFSKSVAYSSLEVLKEIVPTTSGIGSTAVEGAKGLRDLKQTINSSSGKKFASDILRTAKEDIKSGNFSLEKNTDDLFGNMGDIDSWDDLSDDDDEFDIDISEGDKMVGKAILASNATTIDSLKHVSDTIAKTQLKSAEYITHNISNVSVAGFNEINTSLKGVNRRLDVINDNIVQMIHFQNENISVVNQATLDFYDKQLETLNRMSSYLTPEYKRDTSNTGIDFLSGGFSGSGYKDMVKKNFNNSLVGSLLGMGSSMMSMSNIMGTPRIAKELLEAGLSSMIPKKLKKSVGSLDENFSSYLENMLYQMGDKASDYSGNSSPIARFFGEVFGAKRPTSQRISLGNINRESMGWNGTAQQYLVEVIPSYLAKIEANTAKTKEERYYDIEEGVFKSKSRLSKDFYTNRDFDIQYEFFDVVEKLNSTLENNNVALADSIKIKDTVNELVNSRISGDMGFTKDYKNKLSGTLGSVIPNDSFRDIANSIEKAIRESIKTTNETTQDINTASNASVYRNLFNSGKNIKPVKNMKIFNEDYNNYSAHNIKDEIMGLAMGVQGFSEIKDFKITSSMVKEFKDAKDKDGPLGHGQNVEHVIKNAVYKQLGRGYIESTSNTMSDKFKRKFRGTRLGKKFSGIDTEKFYDKIESADQYLFEKMMGFDNDKSETSPSRESTETIADLTKIIDPVATKNVKSDKSQIVSKITAATSRATNGLTPRNVFNKTKNSILEKKEALFNKENYEKITKKTDSELDRELEENKALIEESKRTSLDEAVILTPENVMQSNIQASESIRTSSLGMFSTFTGIVSKLFGESGFFAKFMSNDKVKEMGNTLKNAMFDEETGTFKDVTKTMLDGLDYLKYSFTGKGYTDRKGITRENDEGSVFGRVGKGYDFVHDNTMKHIFGNDDYKNDEKYQKYFSWADRHNKTKPIITDESEEVLSDDSTTPITEAIIETSEKIKVSGDKFTTELFGDDDTPKEKKENEFLKKFKSSMGKHFTGAIAGAGLSIASGGSLGLLGSLFLPSNPIGGAIAGMGISILSQNKKFQGMLFGESDDDGNKTGGLISQNLQDKFKKAMPAIVGGAVFGTLKRTLFGSSSGGLGVLANTLLPGGPLGGAILGVATTMLFNNEKIRKIMFGEKDDDGKSVGGALSKGMNMASEAFAKSKPYLSRGLKGLGIGALTGATLGQMGVIGSALSLGGPVGMGLAGFGISIATSSKRFNELMFGTEEIDEDGQPTGKRIKDGWIHQVRNSVVVNMLDPLKAKVETEATKFAYWAKEKIEFPFRLAFGPILDTLGGLKDDIGDFVKDQFETLTKGIGSVFSTFMDKLLSPVTKTIGKISEGVVGAVGFTARMATMPLAGGLKLISAMTAPTRTKEEIKFWKNYAKSSKDSLSAAWEDEDVSLFGKGRDILSVLTNRDLKDDAREKYSEGMGLEGRNSLDHRGVRRDKKSLKEDKKETQKEQRKWKKIDKLRQEYSKEDGNKEVFWTERTLNERRKELIKAGLSEDQLQTESDIKELIFNKDTWRDRVKGGKTSEAELVSENILQESEDMKDARKETSKYQGRMLTIAESLQDLMFKAAGEQVASERSEKQQSRYDKKLKKFKISPSDINLAGDEMEQFSNISAWEWDLYKTSPEYKIRDFKGWLNRTKSNPEATPMSDISSINTLVKKEDKLTESIEKMSKDIVDRLDSQNEVMYGGEYDRAERKFTVGRPMDKGTIDKAHVSEEELIANTNESSKSLWKTIFGHKTREASRKNKKEREEEESLRSRSLGDNILRGILPDKEIEDANKDEAEILSDEKATKEVTGGFLKGVTDKTLGIFGGAADWIGNSNNLTKLLLLSGVTNIVKQKFPNLFENILNTITDTIIPGAKDFIIQNGPTLLKGMSSIIKDIGPDMIKSSAEVIVAIMPELLGAGLDILKSAGSETANMLMGKANELTNEYEIAETKRDGKNVYTDNAGRTWALGVNDDVVNGVVVSNKPKDLMSGALRLGRNSITNPSLIKTSLKVGGTALGGGIGAMTSMIPFVGGVGNVATGAAVGSKVGKIAGNIGESTLRFAKTKVIDFAKAAFVSLRKFSNDKIITRLFTTLPETFQKNGFKTFVDVIETKMMNALNVMDDKIAAKAAAKMANATAESTSKMAGGLLTGGVITAIFAAYDLASGAFEADRLFNVQSDEVDWIMRLISSLMKAALGFSIGPIFDILLEIYNMITGEDSKGSFATAVYDKMANLKGGSSVDAISELEKNQKNMIAEKDAYNTKNNTNLSLNSYVDKTNQSFLKKMGSGIKNFFTIDDSDAARAAMRPNGSMYTTTLADPVKVSNSVKGISYGPAQGDPRWASFDLGRLPNGKKSTMQTGGCGPTALATIADADPLDVAKMAKEGGYLQHGGSSNKLFEDGARKLGLQSRNVSEQGLDSAIDSKNPLIVSGLSGGDPDSPFTKAGHVINVLGKDSDGNVIIQDPRDGRRKIVGINKLKGGMTSAWQYDSLGTSYGPANNSLISVNRGFDNKLKSLSSTYHASNSGNLHGGTGKSIDDFFKSTAHLPSSTIIKGGNGMKIPVVTEPKNTEEIQDTYMDEAVIEDQSFLDNIIDSPLMSGATGLIGGLSDMLGKVGAVGSNLLNGLFMGENYSRILDDEGNYLDGRGTLLDSVTGLFTSTKNEVKLSGDRQEFLNALLPSAIKASKMYGISPSILLSQAALETGWGKKVKGNNFFGIKASSGWTGKYTNLTTSEYENGKKISTRAKFRSYDTIEESVMDYAKLLNNPRYSKVQNASHYSIAAKELKNAGYATDPSYSQKLINIIQQNGFDYWDDPKNQSIFNTNIRGGQQVAYGPLDDISENNPLDMINQLGMIEESKMEMMLNGIPYKEAKQIVEQRRASSSSSTAQQASQSSASLGAYQATPSHVKNLLSSPSMDVKNWFTKSLKSKMSSDYGMRMHPIQKVKKKHTGIDFAAPGGTPIPTPVAGTIISTSPEGGYGNKVLMKDKVGLYHLFAHLQERSPLPVASSVSRGQIIGKVGTTGSSTGNHLHYEVRKGSGYGTDINPSTYDLNSIIEGYGGLDLNDEDISRLNITKGFSAPHDTNRSEEPTQTNINITPNPAQMFEKLEVVAKTEGVENKLDVIIDIMKDSVKDMINKDSKGNISYGPTIISNTKNSKTQRPVVVAPQQNQQAEKTDTSLRALHEFIAKGR